jgi:hypothetical protein
MNKLIAFAVTALVAAAGCAQTADDIGSSTDQAFSASITRTQVTCQSWNYQYATCDVSTNGGRIVDIRVIHQISTPQGACNEGQSYGIRSDSSIWVDHGCRADFELTIQSQSSGGEYVSCASNNFQYTVCPTDIQDITDVRLVHQDSQSACIQGNSYGYKDNAVWVDHGCRGTFQVFGVSGAEVSVDLFDNGNFSGAQYHVTGTISNFDPLGYNDRASSMIVHGGTWLACQHADFAGYCQSYGPGSYSDLGFLNNQISSIRPE